jgi:hypothetical protein
MELYFHQHVTTLVLGNRNDFTLTSINNVCYHSKFAVMGEEICRDWNNKGKHPVDGLPSQTI